MTAKLKTNRILMHMAYACLFLGAKTVCASSLIDRSVAELYAESDVVALTKIIKFQASCEVNRCGPIKYAANIVSIKKGRVADSIDFCTLSPLTIGDKYILFLRKTTRDDDSRIPNIRVDHKQCEFEVMHDSAFKPIGEDSVYRVWSDTSSEVMERNGVTYFTYAIESPGFYLELSKAIDRTSAEHRSISRLPIPGPWHVDRAMSKPTVSMEQKAQCADVDGKIEQTGLHSYACVYPATDAGKICTDSSQCQAFCMTSFDTPVGTRTTGKCSARVNGSPTGNIVEGEHALGDRIVD